MKFVAVSYEIEASPITGVSWIAMVSNMHMSDIQLDTGEAVYKHISASLPKVGDMFVTDQYGCRYHIPISMFHERYERKAYSNASEKEETTRKGGDA